MKTEATSQTRHQTESRQEEEISTHTRAHTHTQACSIKAGNRPAAAAQDGEEEDAAADDDDEGGGQRGVKDVTAFLSFCFCNINPPPPVAGGPAVSQSAGLDWLADPSVTRRDGQMT